MEKSPGILKAMLREIDTALVRTIAWGLVILVLLVGVLSVIYKAKRSLNPIEYEGTVVNKWAGYDHSDEGSFPYFRLLVETDSGHKLTVAIDRDNYERAKIGMRIKKTQKGIGLAGGAKEVRSYPGAEDNMTRLSAVLCSRPHRIPVFDVAVSYQDQRKAIVHGET